MINWNIVKDFEDITYKKCNGIARVAFNRPEVRNAFRPKTVGELFEALLDAREDTSIGVVLLSGEGPSPKDGGWAFCSGGDQNARGHQGYVDDDGMPRLNILEVQRLIRFMPKVVICVSFYSAQFFSYFNAYSLSINVSERQKIAVNFKGQTQRIQTEFMSFVFALVLCI